MRRSEERAPARNVLGQVADPAALDAEADGCAGVGSLELTVPPGWGGRRATLQVPRAVTCRRCAGGGCDGCDRTGALRTPEEDAARTVHVQLPPDLARRAAVRLPRPFGTASSVAQLVVTFSPGPASPRLALAEPTEDGPARGRVGAPALWIALALGVLGMALAFRAFG